MKITIHNATTGEIVSREMNEEELAQVAKDKLTFEADRIEAEDKALKKAELLQKLGISAEEAALLLS